MNPKWQIKNVHRFLNKENICLILKCSVTFTKFRSIHPVRFYVLAFCCIGNDCIAYVKLHVHATTLNEMWYLQHFLIQDGNKCEEFKCHRKQFNFGKQINESLRVLIDAWIICCAFIIVLTLSWLQMLVVRIEFDFLNVLVFVL